MLSITNVVGAYDDADPTQGTKETTRPLIPLSRMAYMDSDGELRIRNPYASRRMVRAAIEQQQVFRKENKAPISKWHVPSFFGKPKLRVAAADLDPIQNLDAGDILPWFSTADSHTILSESQHEGRMKKNIRIGVPLHTLDALLYLSADVRRVASSSAGRTHI